MMQIRPCLSLTHEETQLQGGEVPCPQRTTAQEDVPRGVAAASPLSLVSASIDSQGHRGPALVLLRLQRTSAASLCAQSKFQRPPLVARVPEALAPPNPPPIPEPLPRAHHPPTTLTVLLPLQTLGCLAPGSRSLPPPQPQVPAGSSVHFGNEGKCQLAKQTTLPTNHGPSRL